MYVIEKSPIFSAAFFCKKCVHFLSPTAPDPFQKFAILAGKTPFRAVSGLGKPRIAVPNGKHRLCRSLPVSWNCKCTHKSVYMACTCTHVHALNVPDSAVICHV